MAPSTDDTLKVLRRKILTNIRRQEHGGPMRALLVLQDIPVAVVDPAYSRCCRGFLGGPAIADTQPKVLTSFTTVVIPPGHCLLRLRELALSNSFFCLF